MKFQEYHGEVGNWSTLSATSACRRSERVDSLPIRHRKCPGFFPRAISPAWPEVGPGAKTQQGKQKPLLQINWKRGQERKKLFYPFSFLKWFVNSSC